jgi:hypothetical protein
MLVHLKVLKLSSEVNILDNAPGCCERRMRHVGLRVYDITIYFYN